MREFSVQNNMSLRNRLGSDTLNKLMFIDIEGTDIESFDFDKVYCVWSAKCRVFHKK